MRRALFIFLPQLPLDRRVRREDPRLHGPFAMIAEQKSAWRLTHLNEPAREAGLQPGISLPDARAICPSLLTEPTAPRREMDLLHALWRWADQFSPAIAPAPPDGLVLDITGCAHLFGGEAQMAETIITQLSDHRITAHIGIADTKGAACALARFACPATCPATYPAPGPDAFSIDASSVDASFRIAPPGATREAIAPLPIAALGLDDKISADLGRLGLHDLAALYPIKSSELARRFGLDLPRALDQILGHAPAPLSPQNPDPIFAARMSLPEPIGLIADLDRVLARLAQSVCRRLEGAQKGARRFRLTVRCVDTGDHHLEIGFARPCLTPQPIQQQFARPLEGLKIAFGADWFRLEAQAVEPLRPRQTELSARSASGDKRQTDDKTDHMISTLGNHLGFDRIRRHAPQDSHTPEREFTTIEAASLNTPPAWPAPPHWRRAQPALLKRPLRLYSKPERLRVLAPARPPLQFEWRRTVYRTKTARGPERLAPEWWLTHRDGSASGRLRDYWLVETDAGPRLWLLSYPNASSTEGPECNVSVGHKPIDISNISSNISALPPSLAQLPERSCSNHAGSEQAGSERAASEPATHARQPSLPQQTPDAPDARDGLAAYALTACAPSTGASWYVAGRFP